METLQRVRKFENFHIVLWLIKDFSWCALSKTLGVCMIVPTVLLAVYITWSHRKVKAEIFFNLAVLAWLCANSIWMIGEFFYHDTLRQPAMVFFATGLLIAVIYYISEMKFFAGNKQ